jgi:phosphate transport system substrate-binding protein
MSSQEFTDSEIAEIARAAGRQPPYPRSDIERVVALDALAIVVKRRNSIPSLGLCEIAKIFAGEITDWGKVGGQPGPIKVHVSTEHATSGTWHTFKTLVLDTCGVKVAFHDNDHPEVRIGAVRIGDHVIPDDDTSSLLLDAMAKEEDDAGIGFAAAVSVSSSVRALPVGGSCGLEQAATTPFPVKTEDYPLARRLYILRPFTLSGYARQFDDFIVADIRADDTVKRQSAAIDQKIELLSDRHRNSIHTDETEADPRSYQAFDSLTRRSQRLSISYRFAFGSEKLDTKARQDILRLAGYLQRSGHPRPTVILAGFADNIGSVRENIELAARRAETVRQALIDILPDFASHVEVRGFGKILPVNCNDTELGRAKNRRVEVFLVQ